MSKKNKKKRKPHFIEKRKAAVNKREVAEVSLRMQHIRISSPIPPPEIMEGYNALMPDAMEKFFALAEKQSNHRQEIEKIEVINQNKRANIGLWAGWSISILFAVIGAFLVYHDKNIAGFTSFICAIMPRIYSFIIARHNRKKQIEEHK